jgi:CheY-like chemotaxis protein
LLVEDSSFDIELITRVFQRLKVKNPLVVVHNGYEALAALRGEEGRERLPRPYIILLDINMPRMNGLEFLDAISADAELRESAVYLMIGHETDKERFADHAAQLRGFLLKDDIGREVFVLPQELQMV